jgi:ribosomal protein S2
VPAGFLTNFDTLKKRIDSMNTMSRFIETDDFRALTKKEKLVFNRKLERIKKIYK